MIAAGFDVKACGTDQRCKDAYNKADLTCTKKYFEVAENADKIKCVDNVMLVKLEEIQAATAGQAPAKPDKVTTEETEEGDVRTPSVGDEPKGKLPERHVAIKLRLFGIGGVPGGVQNADWGNMGDASNSSNYCGRTGFGPGCESADNVKPFSQVSYMIPFEIGGEYRFGGSKGHNGVVGLDVPIYFVKMSNENDPRWGSNAPSPANILVVGAYLSGGYKYFWLDGPFLGGTVGVGALHQKLIGSDGDSIKTAMDSKVNGSKYDSTAVPAIKIAAPFGYRISDTISFSGEAFFNLIPSGKSMKTIPATNVGAPEQDRGLQYFLGVQFGLDITL